MLSGIFSKLYLLAGVGLLAGYFVLESRGVVFSGTDEKPAAYSVTSSGRRGGGSGGGGVFFWGSGYRGGK